MADAHAPRGGAVWEFLLLTFPGGLLALMLLSIIGGGILSSITWAIWPIVSVIIVARRRGVSWTHWGLDVFDRRVLYGAGLAAVIVLAAMLIRWATTGGGFSGAPARDAFDVFPALIGLPVFFIIGAVSEIPWRGFLLTELSERGMVSSVVFSSLAAVAWMGPRTVAMLDETSIGVACLSLLSLAGFQLIACWLRIRTGSIYASAAFYGVWMSVSIQGSAAQDAASATVSAALIVLTGVLLLCFRLPRSDAWPSTITPDREPMVP